MVRLCNSKKHECQDGTTSVVLVSDFSHTRWKWSTKMLWTWLPSADSGSSNGQSYTYPLSPATEKIRLVLTCQTQLASCILSLSHLRPGSSLAPFYSRSAASALENLHLVTCQLHAAYLFINPSCVGAAHFNIFCLYVCLHVSHIICCKCLLCKFEKLCAYT